VRELSFGIWNFPIWNLLIWNLPIWNLNHWNFMKLFGLIGYPLSHSFSKKYFSEKFEREQLAGHRYELFPIEHIGLLKEQVLDAHPELCGLNVTIPYKKEVIAFLDDRSALPLDACNCIKITAGKLKGFNTDVSGFEESLKPLLLPIHSPALILGTGGAAEAVKYVLRKLQIPFEVASRSVSPYTVDYPSMDTGYIAGHKLIINTTPLGTYPNTEACPPIPYDGIGPEHYLFDLVYNPAKSKFLLEGALRGANIKNGADMLEIQAEESWRIWNDEKV
jgi:shikimate dehydrogenase